MTLPITPYLDEICQSLKDSSSHFLILTAETAAGKSTAVPPALLKSFSGKILMLEPRRLAVLSIAERVASLLGEPVGKTAGYRMHLESKVSKETRLEVITEAILTRKLQSDPSLEGVSVVVIDEFHERSIHADLALAFLKEAMALRDNLFVIVMSATIETEKLAAYLGTSVNPAPVMRIPGRQFPVKIEYAGNEESCSANSDTKSVCKAIINALYNDKSHGKDAALLVFLPGIAEIRRCQNELLEYGIPDEHTEILLLHSSISFGEQQKVLSAIPEGKARIILSSAIAETSLTVPGVRLVIDSGLSRINRMNIALGMERFVTENESMFSADQRAGRAGRLGPGKCIRLWSKNEVRNQSAQPEILRTDITTLVLECAEWGVCSIENLDWLEPPNAAAWKNASDLLHKIGCLQNQRITELGKTCLKLGLHPRLACVALSGYPELCLTFSGYANSSPEMQKRFVYDLKRRISDIPSDIKNILPHAENQSLALLSGFPDRIARNIQNGTATAALYQFPSGRVAHLKKEDSQKNATFPAWIVAPEVNAGATEGTIYSFMPLDSNDAEKWLAPRSEKRIRTAFEGVKIKKTENTCYGKLVIASRLLKSSPEDYAAALCSQIQEKGIDSLPLNESTKLLLLRERFYAQQKNRESKSEKMNLAQNASEWLMPFLGGKTKIDGETVYSALYWYLDGATLDSEVPLFIVLSNGKKRKLTYELQSSPEDRTKLVIRPVLEIIIQQIFGCFETPKVIGMPVLLKLLSPARRPLQITDNLENFWKTTWPEICKEMKGRYPKHNWDYRLSSDD